MGEGKDGGRLPGAKCGVPQERVEIAAPALPANWKTLQEPNRFRPRLFFISEAYDMSGGRTEEFYRDVLPPLADLALATGRELIVKLHPGESHRERTAMAERVLSAKQRGVMRIVSGPLTEELLLVVVRDYHTFNSGDGMCYSRDSLLLVQMAGVLDLWLR